MGQVNIAAFLHPLLVKNIGFFFPDQSVPALLNACDRCRLARLTQFGVEEFGPVIRLDSVQRAHDLIEIIGQNPPVGIAHAEKGTREIIERFFALGQIADCHVGSEPDQ